MDARLYSTIVLSLVLLTHKQGHTNTLLCNFIGSIMWLLLKNLSYRVSCKVTQQRRLSGLCEHFLLRKGWISNSI